MVFAGVAADSRVVEAVAVEEEAAAVAAEADDWDSLSSAPGFMDRDSAA